MATELPSQRDDSKSSEPLANVERLLANVIDSGSRNEREEREQDQAREAVRLLLALARLHVSVTVDLKEHADLLAFARSLAGDPR